MNIFENPIIVNNSTSLYKKLKRRIHKVSLLLKHLVRHKETSLRLIYHLNNYIQNTIDHFHVQLGNL